RGTAFSGTCNSLEQNSRLRIDIAYALVLVIDIRPRRVSPGGGVEGRRFRGIVAKRRVFRSERAGAGVASTRNLKEVLRVSLQCAGVMFSIGSHLRIALTDHDRSRAPIHDVAAPLIAVRAGKY